MVSKVLKDNRTYTTVRVVLGLLFLWAGVIKLLQLDIVVMILEVYAGEVTFHVPPALFFPAALFLAILECVTGIGLILNWRGFLPLVTVELLLFILILLLGILWGLDIDCGCFVLHDPDKPIHEGLRPALYRDFGLMAVVLYLFWCRNQVTETD